MHQRQIAWSTEVRGMSLLQRKNRVRMRCGCACRALRADVLRQSWRAYSIKIRSESSFVEFGASKAPVNEHAAGARWRAQARLGLFIWTRRRPRLPLLNGLPPPHTECQNPLFPVAISGCSKCNRSTLHVFSKCRSTSHRTQSTIVAVSNLWRAEKSRQRTFAITMHSGWLGLSDTSRRRSWGLSPRRRRATLH